MRSFEWVGNQHGADSDIEEALFATGQTIWYKGAFCAPQQTYLSEWALLSQSELPNVFRDFEAHVIASFQHQKAG